MDARPRQLCSGNWSAGLNRGKGRAACTLMGILGEEVRLCLRGRTSSHSIVGLASLFASNDRFPSIADIGADQRQNPGRASGRGGKRTFNAIGIDQSH